MSNNSLGGNSGALLVGLSLLLVVFTNPVEELNSGSGQFKMLDANVDPLGDDPVSDLLVDDHSNGTRVDVEDGSSAAVVVLVRHTLVDGSIDNDVDDVSDLVGSE